MPILGPTTSIGVAKILRRIGSWLGWQPHHGAPSGTPQKQTLVLRQGGLGGVSEKLASDLRGIFPQPHRASTLALDTSLELAGRAANAHAVQLTQIRRSCTVTS
jgi:hypothetical protein